MPAIGFRVTTAEINYVIMDGSCDKLELISSGKLRKPKALDLPEALTWYRNNLLGLFREYSITSCGIKIAEPMSRSMGASAYKGAVTRANIEGVIMEAAKHFGLEVVAGPLATISSLIESSKPKRYLKADEFRDISNWGDLNQNFREATLAGNAALCLMEKQE